MEKDTKIKLYSLCFENNSRAIVFHSMIKSELNEKVKNFCVSYETIGVSDIVCIHKYLMKNYDNV